MRGKRATGLLGLVMGLSGCAGMETHQNMAAGPGPIPGGGGKVLVCECGKSSVPVPPAMIAASGPGPVPATPGGSALATAFSAPPAAAVRTADAMTRPTPTPATALSSSSRPIPVPPPAGVARYFPSTEGDRAAGQPSQSPAAPSLADPLGVRASLPQQETAEPKRADPEPVEPKQADPVPVEPKRADPAPVEPKQADPAPVEPKPADPAPAEPKPAAPALVEPKSADSAAPSMLPLSFTDPAATPTPAPAPGIAGPARTPSGLAPLARRAPLTDAPGLGPDLDVSAVQAPAVSSSVAPGLARPARSLALEPDNDPVLAGRPRWDPRTARASASATAEAAHDPNGSSRWVSELAFTETSKKVRTANRPLIVPRPRREVRAGRAEREMPVVTRFFRRVRGAGRAFFHPDLDLIGRETGDLPQNGDGVERASAERLDKAPQR